VGTVDSEAAGSFNEINENEAAWLQSLLEELRSLGVEVSQQGLSRGERGAFTFFPMSSLAKWWPDGELGWVEPYVEWAEHAVHEARSGSVRG
jgi:hypothetical protein